MENLTEYTSQVAMIAPIVAAYVGIAKEFDVPTKYNHLMSLLIAAIFVLVPDRVQQVLVLVSVIGLTASGVYHFSKKREVKSDVKRN
ncbi:hypothetical protein [Cohnella silvisoli]|uniref:Holin n=1 Tax=Cohnella silvisoli TaxID=2873699 RepID=A0ABV1L243_9BACL|nr:hypothetical protein [Cohnella silvisoli]MCD9025734.1 hypothetical protein [Cohnella silvisoli]